MNLLYFKTLVLIPSIQLIKKSYSSEYIFDLFFTKGSNIDERIDSLGTLIFIYFLVKLSHKIMTIPLSFMSMSFILDEMHCYVTAGHLLFPICLKIHGVNLKRYWLTSYLCGLIVCHYFDWKSFLHLDWFWASIFQFLTPSVLRPD